MKTQIQFIKRFKLKHGIDFRKEVFLDNQYNNVPTFNYDFACEIVTALNGSLENQFGYRYVIYNMGMDVESLRTQTLKNYIEDRVSAYYFNHERSK